MNTPVINSEVFSTTRQNKPKCAIVDIDGTVVDCSHRLHHITNGNRNWKRFWEELPGDKPIQSIIDLVNAMSKDGIYIVMVTARHYEILPATIRQLKEIGLSYDMIKMRGDKDFRKDEIVKMEIIRELQKDYDILFALEDRNHNVKAFRAAGISCLQVVEDNEPTPGSSINWNDQTFLTMMIGPSGAGKSTYTKANFAPDQIVSSDDIREQLTGWDRSSPAVAESTWQTITQSDHARVWRAVHDIIETRLRNGLITCLDATNISRRDRMEVLKHVPATQRVRYVIVDRPLDEKITSRGWRSPELVTKHHNSFQASAKHARSGDDQPFVDVVVFNAKVNA